MARMQGKTTSEEFQYFAGVDVSKAHLDLRVFGAGRGHRFANDAAGIAALIEGLDHPHLVVFEPTGRYHLALWRALEQAGHGPVPYNPCLVRHLATGLGKRAKTDQIDARVLSEIAMRFKPEVKPSPTESELEIKELFAARRSAIKRRAMVRTQSSASFNAEVKRLLAAEDAFLTAQIDTLAAALKALFMANSRTRRIRDIILSVPGFAEGAAAVLLAELPEIGTFTRGEIAALTGTAPMTQQSGQWSGPARTRAGRRELRTNLHMNAIVAMTHNPDQKAFADRLRTKGKHSSAIITAVLRKLLVLLNTLVKEDRTWTEQRP